MQKRRFEILLPLKHNDGRPVDGELFEQTREELVAQFGAATLHPQPVIGVWTDDRTRYEDELIRLVIDVDDTTENQQFFATFKRSLLDRFDQIEIYIASHPVDIL